MIPASDCSACDVQAAFPKINVIFREILSVAHYEPFTRHSNWNHWLHFDRPESNDFRVNLTL